MIEARAPIETTAEKDEPTFGWFEVVGLELEYMVVDRATLSVKPIVDQLLTQAAGSLTGEVALGDISWSNELALHVMELKGTAPFSGLRGVSARFQEHVEKADALLAPFSARLLPTAMHPFMDPAKEFRIWPHDHHEVYSVFDRIFDCRGHGWSNLQSTHLNLPFRGDEELGRLHAAVRVLLPILPALAASSPLMDGSLSGLADTRLEVYRHNARAVPSVSHRVVPEAVFTRQDYEERILEKIYADLAPLDPEGILRHEWCNARGAIARFDRSAIEIRVLDIQECPAADLAIAAAVVAAVRGLAEGRFASQAVLRRWSEEALFPVLMSTIKDGDQAVIRQRSYLHDLGVKERSLKASDLWRHLIAETLAKDPGYAEWQPSLDLILSEGCLARRIQRAVGPSPDRARLLSVYTTIADHLHAGTLFLP